MIFMSMDPGVLRKTQLAICISYILLTIDPVFAVIDYRSIYSSDIRVGEGAQPGRKRTGSP